MEYCEKLASESNDSAAEIFRRHLELMKKYGDFFFSDLWPQKPDDRLGLSEEQAEFIDAGKDYAEKGERFTVVCLRRSSSLEGFDPERFTGQFKELGEQACRNCLVPEAMRLREQIAANEQRKKENEEGMKSGKPSWMTKQMHEYDNRPDVVRSDKMRLVELRFYDEVGFAEGKKCEVKHKYRCPYGEESERLVEEGSGVRNIWRLIEWYDSYWNRTHTVSPAACDMKWYHYDEPSIIDVTSYEDILKAVEDDRLLRILEERKKHEKETGSR
jgi:hypothetical protein